MNHRLLKHCLLRCALWFCVCCAAPPAFALQTDRQQPIFIEADRADMDDQKGISVYRGNVTLTQGSMALRCDVLTAHHSPQTRTLIDAVAEGAPAHFRQKSSTEKEEVVATAPRMEYLVDKQLLYLLGDAEVTQGRNVFRGKRIEYSLNDAQVHADGAGTPGGRVRITLLPHEKGNGPSKTGEHEDPSGTARFLQTTPPAAPQQAEKP